METVGFFELIIANKLRCSLNGIYYKIEFDKMCSEGETHPRRC